MNVNTFTEELSSVRVPHSELKRYAPLVEKFSWTYSSDEELFSYLALWKPALRMVGIIGTQLVDSEFGSYVYSERQSKIEESKRSPKLTRFVKSIDDDLSIVDSNEYERLR